MKPKKSMAKEYAIIFGILYLFIVFYVVHLTRVMDEAGAVLSFKSLLGTTVLKTPVF